MQSPKPDLPNGSPSFHGINDADASSITEADVSSFSLDRLNEVGFENFQNNGDQNASSNEETNRTDNGEEESVRNPTTAKDNPDQDESVWQTAPPHSVEKSPFSEDISPIPQQSESFSMTAADLSSFLETQDEPEPEKQQRKFASLLPSDSVATRTEASSSGEIFSALCGTFAKVEKTLNEFEEEVALVRELRKKLTPGMTFFDKMVWEKQEKELRQTLEIMHQQAQAAAVPFQRLTKQLEQSRLREKSAEKELERTRIRVREVKDMATRKGKDQWTWTGESMKNLYMLCAMLFVEVLVLGVTIG